MKAPRHIKNLLGTHSDGLTAISTIHVMLAMSLPAIAAEILLHLTLNHVLNLTSSIPAHSTVLPTGTPFQRMTPYTVAPVLDVTSTMEPTSRGASSAAGPRLAVIRWSVRVSLGLKRVLMLGRELMRDTTFLSTPGDMWGGSTLSHGVVQEVMSQALTPIDMARQSFHNTGLHPRYATQLVSMQCAQVPGHVICAAGHSTA